MVDTNIGGFDMEIPVVVNFVSAFLLFYKTSQRSQHTQITALVERQTINDRKTLSFDHFTANSGNLPIGLRKKIF